MESKQLAAWAPMSNPIPPHATPGAVRGSARLPCVLALCPSAAWSQRSCSAEVQGKA